MNDHANVTVTSDVQVDIDAQDIVLVAFACTSVPEGLPEESVSILTITLSAGAPALFNHIFSELADVHDHINFNDSFVFAAVSPIF